MTHIECCLRAWISILSLRLSKKTTWGKVAIFTASHHMPRVWARRIKMKDKVVSSCEMIRYFAYMLSKLRSRLRAWQQDPEQNSNQEEAIILRIFKDKHIWEDGNIMFFGSLTFPVPPNVPPFPWCSFMFFHPRRFPPQGVPISPLFFYVPIPPNGSPHPLENSKKPTLYKYTDM